MRERDKKNESHERGAARHKENRSNERIPLSHEIEKMSPMREVPPGRVSHEIEIESHDRKYPMERERERGSHGREVMSNPMRESIPWDTENESHERERGDPHACLPIIHKIQ